VLPAERNGIIQEFTTATSWDIICELAAMKSLETLRRGIDILDPLMRSNGFLFAEGPAGPSSGGNFASGTYIKGNRSLEIHFRGGLGLVTYHIGSDRLPHEVFMRAMLGPSGGNRYPGFSDDPLEAFRDLRYDLENYSADFLSGSGEVFQDCVKIARVAGNLSPLERMEQRWPNST
jgi:hypothetical protein